MKRAERPYTGSENSNGGVTRRTFLKGASLASLGLGAGALLAGAAPASAEDYVPDSKGMPERAKPIPAESVPSSWDEEHDVIIVGTGGSGGCATVAALEEGADVLTLEKNAIWGGNMQFSMAWVVPNPFPNEEAYYSLFLNWPHPYADQDPAITRMIAATLQSNYEWLSGMGDKMVTEGLGIKDIVRIAVDPEYVQPANATYPWESDWYQWFPYNARGHSKALKKRTEELGGDIRYSTAATALVQDENGAVVGLKAQNGDGTELYIKGVVVLCTGGYTANDDMLSYYLEPKHHSGIGKYVGLPGATGDGIRMGQGAGATASSMHACEIWSGGAQDPDLAANGPRAQYNAANQVARTPSLSVNKYGVRYADEYRMIGDVYGYVGGRRLAQPDQISFTIIDHKMDNPEGMIKSFIAEQCVFPVPWFADDFADQLKRGIIIKADTLEELAQKIKVPADTFLKTVERYNELCKKGIDEDFFKVAKDMTPLDTPPYYAVKEEGGQLINTWGGLRCNADMQVLDNERLAIPGLFAAGETVTYCAELSRIIPTGRRAGTRAAQTALGKTTA